MQPVTFIVKTRTPGKAEHNSSDVFAAGWTSCNAFQVNRLSKTNNVNACVCPRPMYGQDITRIGFPRKWASMRIAVMTGNTRTWVASYVMKATDGKDLAEEGS